MLGIKIKNIGYVPIPKVACTSVKSALFYFQHERSYDRNIDEGNHMHQYFNMRLQDIDDCDFRFIIIRDPIKRFLSAFNNRVGHHKELSYEELKVQNPELLDQVEVFDPNITQFIDNFTTYYKVKPIKHHTAPISTILPDGLQPFTHIYKIEELKKLERSLSEQLSKKIKFDRLQIHGDTVTLEDLSRKQIEFLIEFYKNDYQLLEGYYSIDDIWEEWEAKVCKKRKTSPFIIWTFRRTGGTNLGSALFEKSDFNGVEHEPFNKNRLYSWIAEDWQNKQDKKLLYHSLNKILSEKPLIKHCLEIMPDELNTALAELSCKYGYKHLFLYRENAVTRLLSLNFSLKTNIWSSKELAQQTLDDKVFKEAIPIKKLLEHEKRSRHKMEMIYQLLLEEGCLPSKISFELLYKGDLAQSSTLVKTIFREILGSEQKCSKEVLEKIIKKGKQNIASNYTRFRNSDKFIKEASKLPLFKLPAQPLVTIVIPVYNVSQYINRCLDSVINQSYKNIEIIVVDDKGTDDSIDKVKQYSDNRISIVTHLRNKGLPAARNTGIKSANGEFIIFLDSDDYISNELIEKCIRRQQQDNVDCVVFNTQFVDGRGGVWPNEWMENYSGHIIKNKCIDDACTHILIGWDVAAWSKMVRLDYLRKRNILFKEEQRYFEDHYFSAQLFLSKIRFSYIDERLHYYFKRSDTNNKSITQKQNPLLTHYRSVMLKDVCLLIESVDKKYKNIFYPTFFSFYKYIVDEAFASHKYQREIYNNLQRAFKDISELEVVKTLSLKDLDIAFYISHYSYDEYIKKCKPVWSFTVDDLKKIIPRELHTELKTYSPHQARRLRFGLGIIVSAAIFTPLCFYKRQFLNYHTFLLRLRDFHIIRRRGIINHPKPVNGILKYLKIFDYVIRGEKEGEKINNMFDGAKYLEMNPSLSSMNMGLYPHFLFYADYQNRDVTGLQ